MYPSSGIQVKPERLPLAVMDLENLTASWKIIQDEGVLGALWNLMPPNLYQNGRYNNIPGERVNIS